MVLRAAVMYEGTKMFSWKLIELTIILFKHQFCIRRMMDVSKTLINAIHYGTINRGNEHLNILLIYPLREPFNLAPNVRIAGALIPPLGVLYLARMLELQGHRVQVIDCAAEHSPAEAVQRVLPSADVVGMTIYSGTSEQNASVSIAKMIKEQEPDLPLVLGGPHCSIFPQKALQDHQADVCVLGEGEHRIASIMNALQGKQAFSSIPGIVFRGKNGFHATPAYKQIMDLDALPFPSRYLVRRYDYGYLHGVKVLPGMVTSMMSSRGCPFRCAFCQQWFLLPHHRTHSAPRIIAEVDELVRTGYTSIAFADDDFLANKRKTETVMDHIIKEGYSLTMWILNARVDSADKTLFTKLRKAGVELIFFGVESGDQEILDFYQKKITLDQVRKAVTLSKEAGFFTSANFIIGAPVEKRRHIQHTMAFARSLPLDNAAFRKLWYLAKSRLWEEAVRQGKINRDEADVSTGSDRGLANFTESEIEAYCNKAYYSFIASPRYWIREFRYALAHNDPKFLRLGLRFMLKNIP